MSTSNWKYYFFLKAYKKGEREIFLKNSSKFVLEVLQAILSFISDFVAFIFDLVLFKKKMEEIFVQKSFWNQPGRSLPQWVPDRCPTLGAWWSDRYQRHNRQGKVGCSALRLAEEHEWGTTRGETPSCIDKSNLFVSKDFSFQPSFFPSNPQLTPNQLVCLPVVGMAVQVAELPDGRVSPPAAVILLGFTFQFEEMRAQVVTIGQIPHDVEEPVSHATREVGHLISRAKL